jgi:hypothetical protein
MWREGPTGSGRTIRMIKWPRSPKENDHHRLISRSEASVALQFRSPLCGVKKPKERRWCNTFFPKI